MANGCPWMQEDYLGKLLDDEVSWDDDEFIAKSYVNEIKKLVADSPEKHADEQYQLAKELID